MLIRRSFFCFRTARESTRNSVAQRQVNLKFPNATKWRPIARDELTSRRKRPKISHGPSVRCSLGRMNNRVGIDVIVMIEIRDRSGLAEMLDPERLDAMALHAAEP